MAKNYNKNKKNKTVGGKRRKTHGRRKTHRRRHTRKNKTN